jgi:hypothetical protein
MVMFSLLVRSSKVPSCIERNFVLIFELFDQFRAWLVGEVIKGSFI